MDIPACSKTNLELSVDFATINELDRGSVVPVEVERWTSTCLQCGRVIRADNQCGCWWRHLPVWAQACVLTFIPVGKFR